MLNSMSDRFGIYTRKLAIVVSAILLMIFAWANLFFHLNINANAATLEGVGNQIEGKIQKDIGTKRRAMGEITDNPSEEAKGALSQVKGKAKQDIGTTQNKLDNAKNKVENESENLVDSVKNIFN